MKKNFYLFIILFSLNFFAQKEANIWYFGDKAGIDFNSGSPVALLDGALNTLEGCASISDSNGNLQFYTDGSTIWTKDHSVMSNGTGLNGNFSSTQSAIIIPKPDASDIYYVFTVDFQGEPNGLQYSEIDMTLNSGLGAVTSTKNVLLLTPVLEKLTAIKHSNNDKKWWELVIKIKNHENEFLMCNARLKTRRWANIMTIISFLCEACPTYVEKSWNSGKNPLELFFGVDSFSNKKTVAEKKRSKVKNP